MSQLFWISHIRKIILISSIFLVLILYWIAKSTTPGAFLSRQIQLYGFAGLIFLYGSLLPSPLYAVFPRFPLRPLFIKARQATGVSAFLFGSLHGLLVIYKGLGGFSQLFLLPFNYLVPFLLSLVALVILSVLAITSPHFISRPLGAWWKPLHRFVYLAGFLILMHAFSIGTHFADYTNPLSLAVLLALVFLITLQAIRLGRFISAKQWLSPITSQVISFALLFLLFIGALSFRLLLS